MKPEHENTAYVEEICARSCVEFRIPLSPRAEPGPATTSGLCHPGRGNTCTTPGAHGMVARGALWHVHPLGTICDCRPRVAGQACQRGWRVDHERRLDPRSRLQGIGIKVQSSSL